MNMNKKSYFLVKAFFFFAVFLCVYAVFSHAVKEKVKMKEVREIAKLPVDKVLEGAPVTHVPKEEYLTVLKADRKDMKPIVSFFYSNVDPESQRLASLLKYISADYSGHILFICVRITEKGKPDRVTAIELDEKIGLDRTPGVLFYDIHEGKVVFEDEDYIHSDFKDFRTPSLMFWPVYYKVVSKKLDEILSD